MLTLRRQATLFFQMAAMILTLALPLALSLPHFRALFVNPPRPNHGLWS